LDEFPWGLRSGFDAVCGAVQTAFPPRWFVPLAKRRFPVFEKREECREKAVAATAGAGRGETA
jgi:hypothetical protein